VLVASTKLCQVTTDCRTEVRRKVPTQQTATVTAEGLNQQRDTQHQQNALHLYNITNMQSCQTLGSKQHSRHTLRDPATAGSHKQAYILFLR
jgi:hypothetical protein